MDFTVLPRLRLQILQEYRENMERYPLKREEVETFLSDREEHFGLCLRFLYGHMPPQDILSVPVETMADYVSASLKAWTGLEYAKTVPQEMFFAYVLHHRVNSEQIDGSRSGLWKELQPLVQGKSMTEAALEVNYWCYSQATYTPSDDRTLGPLSVMRRTRGRCGEESVLAVAALRAVGIPARQCYCPRWSHCDDNHAWVEFWADGRWHYFGACEPEPVPDRGWFTAAASRAMLVHTRCWSGFAQPEPVLLDTPLYRQINCTAHYGDTKTLTVQVYRKDIPQPGITVAFQIVNYSEFFTLHRGRTDTCGKICFTTGLGDLCVTVVHDGKLQMHKVDMRTQNAVLRLELSDGVTPEQLQPMMMDLVPPEGMISGELGAECAIHNRKLRECEARREAFTAAFALAEGQSVSARVLREAAGNWPEIQAFLENNQYSLEKKEEILSTLRQKDLVDITCDVLLDALDSAESVRDHYAPEVFRDYILAPRIGNEILMPERASIRALFPQGFADPAEILNWMQQNLQISNSYELQQFEPSSYGCLRHRIVPQHSFDLVFVAICRTFGFPARLLPDTGAGQWLDTVGLWHSIRTQEPMVRLMLENPTGKPLQYFEHFTLGRWDGEAFTTLQYWGVSLEASHSFSVQPGLYRVITTTRQIDGTASVLLRYIPVTQDTLIRLEIPRDQTAQRLKKVPLTLSDGPVADTLSNMQGQSGILIFAEPGAEPTEHLLQEMLECAQRFRQFACPIHIFVEQAEMLKNTTLQRVAEALPAVHLRICRDPAAEAQLHRAMAVGDLRRPFVMVLDGKGRGVYACANYQIRMAQTQLEIMKLIDGGSCHD